MSDLQVGSLSRLTKSALQMNSPSQGGRAGPAGWSSMAERVVEQGRQGGRAGPAGWSSMAGRVVEQGRQGGRAGQTFRFLRDLTAQ
jgi:general stress protein YciG